MAVEVIGNGGPDGVTLGSSATEKVSLFGETPVVQQTFTSTTTTTVTAAALKVDQTALVAALTALGLLA